MIRIVILVLNLIAFNAIACSFAPAFDDFVITGGPQVNATTPTFTLTSIRRGTRDGSSGSCADIGFIDLTLNRLPSHEQGYIFKIIDGKFEDKIFNQSPVVPSKFMDSQKRYSFLWVDGSSIEQEAINITVEIIAVSRSGHKSAPQILNISHPGVKKP